MRYEDRYSCPRLPQKRGQYASNVRLNRVSASSVNGNSNGFEHGERQRKSLRCARAKWDSLRACRSKRFPNQGINNLQTEHSLQVVDSSFQKIYLRQAPALSEFCYAIKLATLILCTPQDGLANKRGDRSFDSLLLDDVLSRHRTAGSPRNIASKH